jgi:S-(hydroxymethyl)glutathione dehydrogenase/alcohol dehydrogenase
MMQYPIKFKAAYLRSINKDLEINEIYFEGPLKVGQVLVKLSYSGICGKQLDEIRGVHGEDKYLPHLLGHEGVGSIVDIGPGVKKVKISDRVILHWMKGSGIESEPPIYKLNNEIINAGWVTTFNEYAVVSENRITKFEGEEKPEYCLLGCAIPTALGMVFNDLNAKPYNKICIIGAGGVGSFVLQALKLTAIESITVIDKSELALELAKNLNADNILSMDDSNLTKKIDVITNGKGFDKTIITTGNKLAIEFGVEITRTPGETILMGVPKHDEKISVNANNVMHKKNLIGNLGGSIIPERDIPAYLYLLENGKIDTQLSINKIYKFEQINLAIKNFMNGTFGRALIKF